MTSQVKRQEGKLLHQSMLRAQANDLPS